MYINMEDFYIFDFVNFYLLEFGDFMRYAKKLFLGSGLQNNVEQIKSFLEEGVSVFDTYVLCVDEASNNLLYIFTTSELLKKHYAKRGFLIVGFANDKKEAYALTCEIVADFLKKGRSFAHFKHFLSKL